MRQQNYTIMNRLKADYEAINQGSAPILASQGMLVPRGFDDVRFLIKGASRPIVSNGDPAEVQYAGGFTGIVAGVPNTKYSGTLQIIATEDGREQMFAEWMVANGGLVDCDYYDGRVDSFTRVYELLNCAIRFEQAEFDSESRSQVMTISCPYDYNYFGNFAAIGSNNTVQAGQRGIAGASALVERVQSVISQRDSLMTGGGIGGSIGSGIGAAVGRAIGSLFG